MKRVLLDQATKDRVTQLRAQGLTNKAIAGHLNAEGIKPPMGGTWTMHKIQNIVYGRCKEAEVNPTREGRLAAWGRRPGFNDPYGGAK
jgi:hypothetical protein